MVGANAAKLALPESMNRFHPVFHVSLLKPYLANESKPYIVKEIRLRKEDPSAELAVETVLDHKWVRVGKAKNKRFRIEYLIKWQGFDGSHNTWEPKECLNQAAIDSYLVDTTRRK